MVIKSGRQSYDTSDAAENTARAHPLHFILRFCFGRLVSDGANRLYRIYGGKIYLH
ncbi:hypothetical protein [Sulfitobacter sp. M23508]|uniref:hypothetical protein n=1 Tax=Sulfitobacter sp. M23508 TaxID=3368577 RepID=UPI003744E44A